MVFLYLSAGLITQQVRQMDMPWTKAKEVPSGVLRYRPFLDLNTDTFHHRCYSGRMLDIAELTEKSRGTV
jgi:hypothetical protein